ncbi:hypothetical protein SEPCBS57363_001084 [Sporothrix epigloea]|uniref:Uncharacterized protein n=1 Tax=Sporothrix epigloea TaxID=1892477 RepID=A0ABP0DBG5_9PEZI
MTPGGGAGRVAYGTELRVDAEGVAEERGVRVEEKCVAEGAVHSEPAVLIDDVEDDSTEPAQAGTEDPTKRYLTPEPEVLYVAGTSDKVRSEHSALGEHSDPDMDVAGYQYKTCIAEHMASVFSFSSNSSVLPTMKILHTHPDQLAFREARQAHIDSQRQLKTFRELSR